MYKAHLIISACETYVFSNNIQAHGLFWMETLLFVEIHPLQGNNRKCFVWPSNVETLCHCLSRRYLEHAQAITVVIKTLDPIQTMATPHLIMSAGRFSHRFNFSHWTFGRMFITM